MKRNLRFGWVLLAVIAHLGAPFAAFARPAAPMLAGDYCSALRNGVTVPAGGARPLPASDEHHCAPAPCCAGAATDAAVPPPPAPAIFHTAMAHVGAPELRHVSAAPVMIAAAQPRGPPLSA